MNDTDWLWPIEGNSFNDINDNDYLVHICWSKNFKKDYQKLSQEFFNCGYKICEYILNSRYNVVKHDMWFFPAMYLFRQGLELGLKALICGAITNKQQIQRIFENHKHALSELFEEYEKEAKVLLAEDEYEWLKKYLDSLEHEDKGSALFRFPLKDEFLSRYRNKFLDIVGMANSMIQAYGLVQKCLEIPEQNRISKFDALQSSDFLQFGNDGIGCCYLWELITGDGFHRFVVGYSQTEDFLFCHCDEISKEEKLFPIIFLMRNLIELGLKRMYYTKLEHGVAKKTGSKSHVIYTKLWANVRPMIEYYADPQGQDDDIIDIVDKHLKELSEIDKEGNVFRYPASYSLEYKFNDIDLDLKNVHQFMHAIFNFLDCCNWEFKAVADRQSDMISKMLV